MKSFLLNIEDGMHKDLKVYSVENNVSMQDATLNFINSGLQNKPTKNFVKKKKVRPAVTMPEQRMGDHKTFFKE